MDIMVSGRISYTNKWIINIVQLSLKFDNSQSNLKFKTSIHAPFNLSIIIKEFQF